MRVIVTTTAEEYAEVNNKQTALIIRHEQEGTEATIEVGESVQGNLMLQFKGKHPEHRMVGDNLTLKFL